MAYFKEIVKEVKINGKTRQAIDLRAEVYSYDTDVQKFRFPLIVENYEGDFSLTGAKIRSVFIAGESQIIAGGAIESVADNEISVIVPEQLRGYNGSVTLNVVIDLKSGEKIDISDFKFKMTKSKLDTAATKIPEFYYGDVDGYANQAKQQIATILPDVKNQIKKQQDDLDDINGRIDGLQDLTNYYTKSQADNTFLKKDDWYDDKETAKIKSLKFIGNGEVELEIVHTLKNKVKASTVENPHSVHWAANPNILKPDVLSQRPEIGEYKSLEKLDNTYIYPETSVEGNMIQVLFRYDILADYKKIFGENLAETKLKEIIFKNSVFYWIYGRGYGTTGTRLNVNFYINDNWSSWPQANLTDKISKTGGSFKDPKSMQDGKINLIAYADSTDGVTRSRLHIDYAEVITKAKFTINDILPFNNYFKSLETRIKQLEDKLKLGE